MPTNWKLGHECSITIGSNELKLAKDVTVELGGTEIDVSTRGTGGIKQFVLGLQDLTISGTCLYVPDDEAVDALIDAYMNRSALTMTISDPTLTYTGKWTVTRLTNGQKLDDVATLDFTIRPTLERTTP